jgi:DNA-binding response OmpR family regulator
MVIEDAPDILELYREILTEEGYDVALYSYALLALAEVERVAPQLIILDYLFGGEVHGLHALQQLKLHASTAAIPIIMCTAAVKTIQGVEDYVHSKGVQILYKPFDIDELLNLVKQMIQPSSGAAA